jgi:hypothetical protein
MKGSERHTPAALSLGNGAQFPFYIRLSESQRRPGRSGENKKPLVHGGV